MARKKPTIHQDKLPPTIKLRDPVSVDVEGYRMQKGKLHRPIGDFASIQIGVGDDVYVIEDKKALVAALRRIQKGTWVVMNAAFDLRHLGRWSGRPEFCRPPVERLWDIMLMDQLLWSGYYGAGGSDDSGLKKGFSLYDMVRRYYGRRLNKEVRAKFADAEEMDPSMVKYAAEDAWWNLRVRQRQMEVLKGGHPASEDIERIWNDIEGPMIYVLIDWVGPLVNEDRWRALAEGYKQVMDQIRETVDFNPGSTQQVKARLHAEGHRVRNVQAATIRPLYDVSETARIRLDYKKAEKRYGTYGIRWANNHIEPDGRVYSDYHQYGTVTARLASSGPNLQNIPVREGTEYRECFIAPSRGRLLVLDYEQQEPRITAFRSQDERLLSELKRGEDVHLAVARAIFDEPDMRSDDPRRSDKGKPVNLALVYGMTARGLAAKTGMGEWEADTLMRKYFDTFPGVATMMARDRAMASAEWYVKSVTGRVIWVNLYNRAWSNFAANYPIQTTGADIMKRAMVLLAERFEAEGMRHTMRIQVHDELVVEAPAGMTAKIRKMAQAASKQAAHEICPGLPFPVEIHSGYTWACKQEDK